MAVIDARTRDELARLETLVKKWDFEEAERLFRNMVARQSRDSLLLLSPDLKPIVEGFFKKKRRSLAELLDKLLTGQAFPTPSSLTSKNHIPSSEDFSKRYAARLAVLRDKHIFQWTTHYRDTVNFIFKEMLDELSASHRWEDTVEAVRVEFRVHAKEIFSQGYAYSSDRGVDDDVTIAKSIHGLQRFIYLVMGLLIEQRDIVHSSRDAALAWEIISSLLMGILEGYGSSVLGQTTGWELLRNNLREWLPALGFARGSDVLPFLEEFPIPLADVYATVGPTLLAVEQFANNYQGDEFLLPRLSRAGLGVPRLDVTYSIKRGGTQGDLVVSAFFEGEVRETRDLSDVMALYSSIAVAQLAPDIRDWSDVNANGHIIDASEVRRELSQARNLAELISARLNEQAMVAAGEQRSGFLSQNFALNFPLDDPDFRRLFTVERYSVKQVLVDLQRGTGAYVWCSVRRSGKTTAASSLGDAVSEALVVFQSMDQRPTQLEVNILERAVREALIANIAIAPNFFQNIVDACVSSLGPQNTAHRKRIFIIDEYESLFGLLAAYASRDQGVRFTVAQPLLSQMLGFASKNILILMGQQPDAHQILLSQNQLSPNVRQHNFPLFGHQPGVMASEFSQFLRRVLTEKMPFSTSFADSVHDETRGHPYLTVNVMVDFCAWLIEKQVKEGVDELQSEQFKAFSRERLSVSQLPRSPYYGLFHKMLAEFLSEQSREQEPWLYAVTSVLRDLARKHPQRLACSLASFETLAEPYARLLSVPPARLLSSAVLANFLRSSGGMVSPGIPLMVRLAGSSVPRIN